MTLIPTVHQVGYALDTMLCATSLAHPGRVSVLISDVEGIRMVTAAQARMVEKV
ncbi:hypothetical protein OHT20_09830 [Streptomyces caniferus]|uniref:Guanylate cyclase domain-containing protein n=1 Tax=Streptomyces caniferus TaxID=285557 RepID=A0ABZ1VGV5_9ACTN|nr:hypothetical protein [Streptomyces caniferus]